MPANDCPFQRAILTSHFACSQSRKTFIGEKEGIVCTNTLARENCRTIVEQLKKNSRFALQLDNPAAILTHGQDMKLKCGGLQGLRDLGTLADSNDIYALISAALDEYGDLSRLPYEQIVRTVSTYKSRRRS